MTVATIGVVDKLIDDQKGFAAAVRTIMPALRGYARRLTRHDANTDDLVQETLVRAWAARTRFQPGTNFKAWLFRIARNIFLTGTRRSWRSTPLDPVAHASLLVGSAEQEDGLYSKDLDQALATIPSLQREALQLIVETGLTYEEAAVTQHVEIGTLKSRVARARSALTRYFDTQGDEPVRGSPVETFKVPHSDPRRRYELWKASGTRTIG